MTSFADMLTRIRNSSMRAKSPFMNCFQLRGMGSGRACGRRLHPLVTKQKTGRWPSRHRKSVPQVYEAESCYSR